MIWGPLLLILGALTLAWPGGRPRRLPKVPVVALAGRVVARLRRAPRQALGAAIGAAVLLGLLGGGPVAGVVAGAYAAIGGRALMRRSLRRRVAAERAAALDGLAALAADLRAGLPAVVLPSASRDPRAEDRLERLTASVSHLAERTGAPAADLVERIEADARAADRAGASASAQAAGAQATSMLLAALPVAGIGLGFLMGANPFTVLLRTPLGAACALVAVALQTIGLLWSERLMSGVTP